jgi:hypothetical protein
MFEFKNPFGVKLIYHNHGGINLPDDKSMPYKLEATYRRINFMPITLMGMGIVGPEKIIIRGNTFMALKRIMRMNGYGTHPRLSSLTITGPDGVELELPKKVLILDDQAVVA